MKGRPEAAAKGASERGLGGKSDERSLTERKLAFPLEFSCNDLINRCRQDGLEHSARSKVQGGVNPVKSPELAVTLYNAICEALRRITKAKEAFWFLAGFRCHMPH
jgi:hypothetical protein